MIRFIHNLRWPVVLLLTIVIISGCASSSSKLQANSWEATSFFDGQSTLDVWPDSGITAIFGEDDQLTGNGGCNSYSASYTSDGDSISIGPLSSTQMACEDTLMARESAYLAALQSATTFKAQDQLLELKDATGNVVVTYEHGPS